MYDASLAREILPRLCEYGQGRAGTSIRSIQHRAMCDTEYVPASPFLVILCIVIVAIAHQGRRQEQLRLARVREGAVVVVEEYVKRDEQCPRSVQEVLNAEKKRKKRTTQRRQSNQQEIKGKRY